MCPSSPSVLQNKWAETAEPELLEALIWAQSAARRSAKAGDGEGGSRKSSLSSATCCLCDLRHSPLWALISELVQEGAP